MRQGTGSDRVFAVIGSDAVLRRRACSAASARALSNTVRGCNSSRSAWNTVNTYLPTTVSCSLTMASSIL